MTPIGVWISAKRAMVGGMFIGVCCRKTCRAASLYGCQRFALTVWAIRFARWSDPKVR
jgi:hypothetical protein